MTLALTDNHDDTHDLTPYLSFPLFPPPLRRPDAVPVLTDETLTLPPFAWPAPPRVPVRAYYNRHVVKPLFKRGRRRMSWSMRLNAMLVGGAR